MRIGVDFDNTIAGYDRLFEALAAEAGLLPAGSVRGKTAVRDALRAQPEGETAWRRLQALAYGPRIAEAELLPGVEEFFRACRERGVRVRVVSHKTRLAAGGDGQTDLRQCAREFLRRHGAFAPAGWGLNEADVFFEPTREAKAARIRELGCTHFVDDLPEVFQHPDFPPACQRLLFDPAGAAAEAHLPGARRFVDWRGVLEYVFPDAPPQR